MKVTLKNEQGLIKQCKVGFSWTVFFFGCFVPLFRGDWKWFLIMLVGGILTLWIVCIILAFIYNRIYIHDLLSSGFGPAEQISEQSLRQVGYIA